MDIHRAKEIVSALAEGINPITDSPLPEDSICNHAEVVRALYAVLHEETSEKKRKPQKKEFYLDDGQKQQYVFSPAPISASEMIKQMNALADLKLCYKLTYAVVVNWLIEIGALEVIEDKKQPTTQGEMLGIHLDHRVSPRGPYTVVTYDSSAQQFIMDHLEAIAERSAATRPSNRTQCGRPWTPEQETELENLFHQEKTIKEIAAAMQRTTGGIRARLKKMGLLI